MCKGLIYDILMTPLSITDPLRGEVNYSRLSSIASELIDCFYRASKDFPIYPEFFMKPIINERIESNSNLSLRIRTPNPEQNNITYSEYIWDKFYNECPIYSLEILYAIELCKDTGITKDYINKKSLSKQFLIDKLVKILSNIPIIHNEHTARIKPDCPMSPGPINKWNIVMLRRKAGLSITQYLEDVDDFSLYD